MKPILFKTEMSNAIISGHKTQTRRIINVGKVVNLESVQHNELKNMTYAKFSGMNGVEAVKFKFGTIGSLLWVKETFFSLCKYQESFSDDYMSSLNNDSYKIIHVGHYRYNQKDCVGMEGFFWKKMPSLFMPKKASRITIQITDIQAERLLDISESDAKSEGVLIENGLYKDYLNNTFVFQTAKESFFSLWQMVNGEGSHHQNPFVWVVKFKKIAKRTK